jgi:GTP-binding protein
VSSTSTIVIVGRPNVGKSTLFNRLTRSRRALVHDLPGVTRDRIVGEAHWLERTVTVVDTGGLVFGVDEDAFIPLIRSQADAAIREADAVVLLVDGESGVMPEDHEIAAWLRTMEIPVVLAVNKSDRRSTEHQANEFFRLGLDAPVLISAEHGRGIDDLWQALAPHLSDEIEEPDTETADPTEARIAIIGRPNVGKSSLLNRLVGDERSLVSDVAGTTRDAVDVVLERDGRRFRFVDTAGIRRKGRTEKGPEVLSVVMARRALERAHVCVLVVDAQEGFTRQDVHVGGYAWEAGKALALVVNKWDLVEGREAARARLEDDVARHMKFAAHAPAVFLSALTGRGVHRLFPVMAALHDARGQSVTTATLNRIIREAWQRNPPSVRGRKEPKFFYASQIQSSPPTFVLFTNLVDELHFSYQRYLDNVLREALGLDGVPVRVMIRGRKN